MGLGVHALHSRRSLADSGGAGRISPHRPSCHKAAPYVCPRLGATLTRTRRERPQRISALRDNSAMSSFEPPAHSLILAVGRGTGFWPRSLPRSPKQLLNIVGQKPMLEQTYERLAPLFPSSHIWVVTHREQARAVSRQFRQVASSHI